jgi:hypothetical protein
MKIKKFKNLWTMGLLLCCGILVTFYILKLACPEFIVGVAELPTIVSIGTFIDTHSWAYFIYNIVIGFLSAYIYCGACCRKTKFNWKECLIILSFVLLLRGFNLLMPNQYNAMNYVVTYITPFIICLFNKSVSQKTFISTSICFCVDIVSQVLSLEIRNLIPLSKSLNIATITILLIDGYIWRTILYLFFNYKTNREETDYGN